MTLFNKNIRYDYKNIKVHSKASEKFVDVTFKFKDRKDWNGWIPIENRRAGLFLKTREEIDRYLDMIYNYMKNNSYEEWLKEEEKFWEKEKPRAYVTKKFFDELAKGGWKCARCQLPSNTNFARRIQDLKDFGYMISTDTNRYCPNCKKKGTHILMVPVKRFIVVGNGYEYISSSLRKKIIKILNNYDCYEGKIGNNLLPDHKFPEIRWGHDTKEENSEDMTDIEIKDKFQLMSNQRNLQKREVCRNCYQTGKRGAPFGIKFYYAGNENWDKSIPPIGKEAEKGCIGCGWYDMEKWRNELNKKLIKSINN